MYTKKDYTYTTNSLNVIKQTLFPYDVEHADITLADGSSLKEHLIEMNKPKPPVQEEEDTSLANKAIVDVSKSK